MMKPRILKLTLILLSLFVGYAHFTTVQASTVAETRQPTLFFHGYGSSYHAEQQMAQAAVKAGKAKSIIRAEVSRTGHVKLIGKFAKKDRHPIVEVNYEDNRNSNYHTDGLWARNVVLALQKKYQIKQFNMVGHSMGNMAIMYYLLDYGQDQGMPKLCKQVDIAGHFNGILGQNDKPNQMK